MQQSFDFSRVFEGGWTNQSWGISVKRIRKDLDIQGSPQRTMTRTVIEDNSGRLFLIEVFEKKRYGARQQVAEIIDDLKRQGISQILGYEKNVRGEFLVFQDGYFFGATPYINDTGIQRPQYLENEQIGREFSIFLKDLSIASNGIENRISLPCFDLPAYIRTLSDQIKMHDSNLFPQFKPFLDYLEKHFFPQYDRFPTGLCHGDLHPLNVIWDGEKIRAVIDWEFSGIKPRMYDAATLLGCAGIENPEGLSGPMVHSFFKNIRKNSSIMDTWWHFLPEFILALRFAWLSEWLRNHDREMIDLETAFMEILLEHLNDFRRLWALP